MSRLFLWYHRYRSCWRRPRPIRRCCFVNIWVRRTKNGAFFFPAPSPLYISMSIQLMCHGITLIPRPARCMYGSNWFVPKYYPGPPAFAHTALLVVSFLVTDANAILGQFLFRKYTPYNCNSRWICCCLPGSFQNCRLLLWTEQMPVPQVGLEPSMQLLQAKITNIASFVLTHICAIDIQLVFGGTAATVYNLADKPNKATTE